jgi:hypothetical protein
MATDDAAIRPKGRIEAQNGEAVTDAAEGRTTTEGGRCDWADVMLCANFSTIESRLGTDADLLETPKMLKMESQMGSYLRMLANNEYSKRGRRKKVHSSMSARKYNSHLESACQLEAAAAPTTAEARARRVRMQIDLPSRR